MKTGISSIVELAKKIESNANAKLDLVADTREMKMNALENGNIEMICNAAPFGVNNLAHQQIGTYYGINKPYYEKMLTEAPQLLERNVNHWMAEQPARRLVRTLDGNMRAFLSDSYRPLENEDLAAAVLPILMDMNLLVLSCDITETRLYIKCVDASIERDVPTGRKMGDGTHTIFDTCSPVIVISNSEVGAGALKVESGVFTRACTNLAVFPKGGMRKRHLGQKHELTDGLTHLLTDETKRATDRAVWLQVRDVIKGAFDEANFEARMLQLGQLRDNAIPDAAITSSVGAVVKKFGMTEGEGKSVLANLIRGGDLSQYGMFNAITRTAEDLPSYDRASEFELIGGKFVDLPASQWREITRVAA